MYGEVSRNAKGWFKTGGTTEIADNFVPVDVKLVGFIVFGRMQIR
jgi:hypothetical protein